MMLPSVRTPSTSSSSSAFSIIQNGNGVAGYFEKTNVGGGGNPAIEAVNSGVGRAGIFKITNSSNAEKAIWGLTEGVGQAGWFEINNSSSPSQALYAWTNGIGNVLNLNHFNSLTLG